MGWKERDPASEEAFTGLISSLLEVEEQAVALIADIQRLGIGIDVVPAGLGDDLDRGDGRGCAHLLRRVPYLRLGKMGPCRDRSAYKGRRIRSWLWGQLRQLRITPPKSELIANTFISGHVRK